MLHKIKWCSIAICATGYVGCSVIGKLLIMLQFQEIIIYDINGREGGGGNFGTKYKM